MTFQPLTADLCARAIVAAARSFGDDPIKAVLGRSGAVRRSIAPAGVAVASATNTPVRAIAQLFGLANASNWSTARRSGGRDFEVALCAALLATGQTEFKYPDPRPKSSARRQPAQRAIPAARLPSVPISAGPSAPQRPAALPAAPKSTNLPPAGKPPARLNLPAKAAPPPPASVLPLTPPAIHQPWRLPLVKTCKWVDGEGCEAPVVAGKSYCAEHAALVYVPGSAKEPRVRSDVSTRRRREVAEEILELDGRRLA